MNCEHEPRGGESSDEPRRERQARERPAIYAASLSDYNEGRLHGVWIDAAQEPEQLAAEVKAMLDRSPSPGAEEWAIHDYDGFGPLRLGEQEPLERIAALAQGIVREGPGYAHWAALFEGSEPAEDFQHLYLGHWTSVEEYVEMLVDDLGYNDLLERAIPDNLRPYVRFDVAAYAGDLEAGGEIVSSPGEGGVYLFGPGG
jgi:antirestriction protein